MHGTFKSRPPNRRPRASGGNIQIIFGLLLREITVGCVLYLLLGRDPGVNIVICTTVLGVLLALTNKYGLLRRQSRMDIMTESLAILMGGLGFRRLIAMALVLLASH